MLRYIYFSGHHQALTGAELWHHYYLISALESVRGGELYGESPVSIECEAG